MVGKGNRRGGGEGSSGELVQDIMLWDLMDSR